ncbi:MvdC/MvdD family ATP grasp protein [Actinosynnema sp. NPDC049800]
MQRDVDILVIGTSIDPHIDAVLGKLPRSLSVVRFDVDRFPRESRLSLSPLAVDCQVLLTEGREVLDISRPQVVWFRRLGAPGLPEGLPDRYRQFCLGEAEQALEGMLNLIRPNAWINEYWSTRQAANKPRQYAMAQVAGLHVPKTFVSNDPVVSEAWLNEEPYAVVKSLHSPMITKQDSSSNRSFAFTRLLTEQDRKDLTDVATTPCQFQPYVKGRFELRVTSIGNRHFAVRIDKPIGSRDVPDWRPVTSECTYRTWHLPSDVGTALSRFMADLGLEYAASDFIVDESGKFVFLESNPHGAWLWLEEAIPGLGIAENFARHLTLLVQR